MWCLFRDNSWLHSYNQVWKRQPTILRLTHSDLNFSVVAVKKLWKKWLASFITHIFSLPESILQSSTLFHFSIVLFSYFFNLMKHLTLITASSEQSLPVYCFIVSALRRSCMLDPSLTKHLSNWCITWANLISWFDQNILYTLCHAITPQMLLMIGTLSQYHSNYVFIDWY